jgi:hypothetical protein
MNITHPTEVEPHALGASAWELLTDILVARGNTLSGPHAVALLRLMELFSGYASGATGGRVAFPLPTGMGKTTGIVAFIATMHRMGYRVPVAVAASRVQALVTLRRELLELGVPEEDIGLAHRDASAEVPSTGCRPEDGRLVQLVTHARVRMGEDHLGLFQQYQGHPRALMVYDETMFRSDAFAFLALTVRSAVDGFMSHAEAKPELAPVAEYLHAAVRAVRECLETAAQRGDPRGVPLELPELPADVIEHWKALLGKTSRPRADVEVLQQFLDVSQLPLQVLTMTQGGGAVAVRAAVSDQLDNVVILDASTPVRELVALDPSVRVFSPMPEHLKSFEAVEVLQLLAAGGRSSMEQSFTDKRNEASSVSREVVSIVTDELALDPKRCFLFFTFKRSTRKDLDMKEGLRAAIKAAGLDPEELVDTPEGQRPRFNFLHWGQHEGQNGFEFCETVILAGVLHRAHLDIAAAIKGQQLDLSAPTPHELVTKVIKSEVAHCVYQAASRGSCRRVTKGKANAMRLWLIHLDPGLKDVLEPVMPRAQWSWPEPRHIKKATLGQQGAAMRGRILEALRALPDEVLKVSTRALKDRMGLEKTEAVKKAFTRAMQSLDLQGHGWQLEGQSLVRGATAYGF